MNTWHQNLGIAIRSLAERAGKAYPDMTSAEMARFDLVGAAHIIEAGGVSQGVPRLFFDLQRSSRRNRRGRAWSRTA